MERATLLLEIGCEEMPAAFMRGTLEQLQAKLAEMLDECRLEHGAVRTLGTPRRLIALVSAVALQQTPEERVVRGPAKRACFDAHGNPTQALIGFARSRGVEPDAVQFQETPQGEYAFIREYDAGQPAADVLADALPKLLLAMTFPKTLRWGSRKIRFGRPIRWIVAMLGQTVIPFELEGIPSGRHSRGHRFLSPEPFEVESPEAFLEQLRRAHVIAEPAERERIIIDGATRLAHTIGAHAVLEPALVEENVFLVELPHLLLGSFPESFLRLPAPVLVSAMKKHEKFFPVVDSAGALLPHFISVYNNGDPDKVREGNEWVLIARFNDAAFFFEEDRKQPLEAFVPALGRILYQQKLGTLLDKAHRLERVAEQLAGALDWDAETTLRLLRAARLCKGGFGNADGDGVPRPAGGDWRGVRADVGRARGGGDRHRRALHAAPRGRPCARIAAGARAGSAGSHRRAGGLCGAGLPAKRFVRPVRAAAGCSRCGGDSAARA
jgi:glycyl-tRNA synthetase beta chain